MTRELAPTLKAIEQLINELWSYPAVRGDLGIRNDKHIRYLSFFKLPNNNTLERKRSNFKNRARPFRGIRSDVDKMAYIERQIFYYNCLKSFPVPLKIKTPYQTLTAPLPEDKSKLDLIHKPLAK